MLRFLTLIFLFPLVLGLAQDQAAALQHHLIDKNLDSGRRWGVAATEMGMPYVLPNGDIGYLFGDTMSSIRVQDAQDLRSPVMLRSGIHPREEGGIRFESAAGVVGDGLAPGLFYNGLQGDDGTDTGIWEFTVLPNDGISFPETGEHIVSYVSIMNWTDPATSNYAGLAYSLDGDNFVRLDVKWHNNDDNTDPFQRWTMQRDGDWVYVFSIRSVTQYGPMMLQRVPWDRITDKDAFEGWGWNGEDWGWGRPCSPILSGDFGMHSVRKLQDGTWAMVYSNASASAPQIVSRSAKSPTGPWSDETMQVMQQGDGSLLYSGFIHPWSSTEKDGLFLLVTNWTSTGDQARTTGAAANLQGFVSVSQYAGTL
ncbi:hypothetical protein BDW42DRAFT_185820 [Aspergillus taichungensis]|uniref:DUF4185 domain-containing protein n=1 Tax=Aspergillus taichungensis TaxID=482145 RepID=A0A2J5HTV4_9EURO|nr:hypothetical protein BDW42DRAFT_185820 [Aspergillus taichungensis]